MTSSVTVRPLTRDNLWDVVELKLHPGQEAFVAPNIESIANASVEPTFVPLADYAGDDLVGFAMYGQHPPDIGAWGDPPHDCRRAPGSGLRPGRHGSGHRHDG